MLFINGRRTVGLRRFIDTRQDCNVCRSFKLAGFLLLTFLLSRACRERVAYDLEAIEISTPSKEFTDDQRLIGEWTMCTTSYKDFTVQMNICPTVAFKMNGKGELKNSSVVTEVFDWKLKGGKLKISYVKDDIKKTFSDSTFEMGIVYEKGAYDAKISGVNKKEIIYLKR